MSDADSPPLTPDGIAHDWWSRLTTGREPQSRGTLARLRRASTPLDITMIPASLTLMRRLRGFDADRVATLAGVLAHVTSDTSASLPRTLGPGSDRADATARLSEARLRRLLHSERGELLPQLIRVVRMAGGTASVRELARTVLYWGDHIKRQWIYEYYGAQDARGIHADTPRETSA